MKFTSILPHFSISTAATNCGMLGHSTTKNNTTGINELAQIIGQAAS